MSDYLHFFSQDQADAIVAAIAEAEMRTSGELRVHVEDRCKHRPVERAFTVFEKLGMHETKERNGVLFYLSTLDHEFAVIGDEGIHEKVGEEYWTEMRDQLEAEFCKGRFAEGLVASIRHAGLTLAEFFPRRGDDVNELDNSISSQRN